MVTYGSAATTIRMNRAADAALVWALAPSAVQIIGQIIGAAEFAAKPKHRTMQAASTGVAMK
jgi:hypothetical protein